MKRVLLPVVCFFGLVCSLQAEVPRVLAVKRFARLYPASSSLQIPFHGCVVLEKPLPAGEGEYWLSLDELIKDEDFHRIQVLVDANGGILGARAEFRGSEKEWSGERGYEARKRVLFVFGGGDGPEFTKELPAAYDGSDFGGMIYTFDRAGHVSWRKVQGDVVMTEAEYVRRNEEHSRGCDECKNIPPQPGIVLSLPTTEPAKE